MAVEAQRVVVGDTPTLLSRASTDSYDGSGIVVRPKMSAIDIGGPAVVSGQGFEVAADETVSVDLEPREVIYGIASASSTVTVHVLRRGV